MDRALDNEPLAKETPAQQASEGNSRHRQWVSKGRIKASKKLISWRPQPRYRVAVKKILRTMDNQLKVGTASGGLTFFQWRADNPGFREANWQTWPYLCINLDHAFEHMSGFHYGERAL